MQKIFGYLKGYAISLNKTVFIFSTLFTALAVYINYHYGLNKALVRLDGPYQFAGWYLVFLLAFSFAYWMAVLFAGSTAFQRRKFVALLLLAPALFAWKMTFALRLPFSTEGLANEYWNAVFYWPAKVAVMVLFLAVVHRVFDRDKPFYGVSTTHFSGKPYLFMLLVMVPLVAAASTQPDFLHLYPRYQNFDYLLQPNRGLQQLLFELAYGSDFFSIELFFRGFLVLAFARWAGKDAILPMAIFYCTIHFGKPLGECISSYFGGIILGVVSYHTRSILGGFLVHVGIAWLMEAGGYLGHQFW